MFYMAYRPVFIGISTCVSGWEWDPEEEMSPEKKWPSLVSGNNLLRMSMFRNR